MNQAAETRSERRSRRRPGEAYRLWLGSLVALASLGALAVPAQANHDYSNDLYDDDYVERTLNQSFAGYNELHLRQLLNLGPQHDGAEVEYVVLRARTQAGRGNAQLILNQRADGHAQTVGVYTQSYFFFPSLGHNMLGSDIRSLEIGIQGRFTVESVGVKLADRYTDPIGRGDRVTRHIGRSYSGRSILNVRQLLNLGAQYNGSQVRSVILRARSIDRYIRGASAQLLVDGLQVGPSQYLSDYTEDKQFLLYAGRNELGRDIRHLEIDLDGEVIVDSITVQFDGLSNRPVRRILRAPVSREYRGNSSIRLIDLLPQLGRAGINVRSVTLIGSTRAGRGRAALCGIRTCTVEQIVDAGRDRTVFNAVGLGSAQSLELNLRGNHFVDEIQVEITGGTVVRPGPRPRPRPPVPPRRTVRRVVVR